MLWKLNGNTHEVFRKYLCWADKSHKHRSWSLILHWGKKHKMNPPKRFNCIHFVGHESPHHLFPPVTFKVCRFYVQNYNHNHKICSVHICSNPTSAGQKLRSIPTDEKWLMKIKICQINIWHWKLLIKFTAYITGWYYINQVEATTQSL